MEGYLLKWTNYVFGWQRRYFTFSQGKLQYSTEKDSGIRGVIHLDVSQVIKHPRNSRRFYIDTGLTLMHLKADTVEEAAKWCEYLAVNKDSNSAPLQKNEIVCVISEKIAEICSIHAQILAEADLLPINLIKTTPGVERAVTLCGEMKEISLETLKIIESQEEIFKKSNELESIQENLGFYEEDSGVFVDAQSQVSDTNENNSLSIPYRKSLPYLRDPNQKINIWKVIRDSIGLELSKIAVPVYFNEPLSFLQRFSEDLSYNSLITTASNTEDSCLRLGYIASFIVSSYTSSDCRTMKPFNPLLGETFDLEKDGFRLITEQVSHHPPISALNCEHPDYLFYASTQVKTSFKGTYLNVTPQGTNHLILKKHSDHYVWTKPHTNVHNIIIGKIYVEHYGSVEVNNINNGEKAILNFKKQGWFDRSFNDVTGAVYDPNGLERYKLVGKWNRGMKIVDVATNQEIQAWETYPYPDNYQYSYYFSEFALQLNLPPDLVKGIAATDSRHRPDQRALELGDIGLATSEKQRLEEKQRDARKAKEKNNEEHIPRWFAFKDDEWKYKGGYWESKDRGYFEDLYDIY